MTPPWPELILRASERAEAMMGPLAETLDHLPATRCDRKATCCSLLPGMSLIEAIRIYRALDRLSEQAAGRVRRRLIEYFHLNPVRIMGCPFLEDSACLVYEERPFGCRGYGLWSPKTYRKLAEASARAQEQTALAWQNLGIALPASVTGFRPVYCRKVRTLDGVPVGDDALERVNHDLRRLDRELSPWSEEFGIKYSGDLSFLVAAGSADLQSALRDKVSVVREYLEHGRSIGLDYILDKAGVGDEPWSAM